MKCRIVLIKLIVLLPSELLLVLQTELECWPCVALLPSPLSRPLHPQKILPSLFQGQLLSKVIIYFTTFFTEAILLLVPLGDLFGLWALILHFGAILGSLSSLP